MHRLFWVCDCRAPRPKCSITITWSIWNAYWKLPSFKGSQRPAHRGGRYWLWSKVCSAWKGPLWICQKWLRWKRNTRLTFTWTRRTALAQWDRMVAASSISSAVTPKTWTLWWEHSRRVSARLVDTLPDQRFDHTHTYMQFHHFQRFHTSYFTFFSDRN